MNEPYPLAVARARLDQIKDAVAAARKMVDELGAAPEVPQRPVLIHETKVRSRELCNQYADATDEVELASKDLQEAKRLASNRELCQLALKDAEIQLGKLQTSSLGRLGSALRDMKRKLPSAKPVPDEIGTLVQAVEDVLLDGFHDQIGRAQAILQARTTELAERENPNLDAFQDDLEEARERADEARKRWEEAEAPVREYMEALRLYEVGMADIRGHEARAAHAAAELRAAEAALVEARQAVQEAQEGASDARGSEGAE